MDTLLIKQCLFHGSWLALPFAGWLLWRLRRRRLRWLHAAALLATLLFCWARFVEPQLIRVQHTTLAGTGSELTIALISDLHLGVYKQPRFLERTVAQLRTLPVDAVLIAGDFTYEPDPAALEAMFAPLAQLQVPVYAVLGNHDQQAPGPDIDRELRAALTRHGVQLIEGREVDLPGGARLAGLGDRWAGKDDPGFLAPSTQPPLVLVHNPDSAIALGPQTAALVLAGHTHGGQIRIPWLYRYAIPSRHGFDRGEQVLQTPAGPVRVYTTVGLGEIGLPMRLFNPPTIDVLQLHR